MLKGKELGNAIAEAIRLKLASGSVSSKKEIADHFDIQPPSIHDWIKKGSISKDKLPELWNYFSDVVGPEHWGLNSVPFGSEPIDSSKVSDDDSNWIKGLSVPQYELVKKFALIVAKLGEDGVKATDKIIDGTNDVINVERQKKPRSETKRIVNK